MRENVPDSIYECEKVQFNDGSYAINWAVVWDIIRAYNWAKARLELANTVRQDGELGVLLKLPDSWQVEIDYDWCVSLTNSRTIQEYSKFRESVSSSKSIQPLINSLAWNLQEQMTRRQRFASMQKRVTERTQKSINDAVRIGKIWLGGSTFMAETSADILLLVAPYIKTARLAYKGATVAGAGAIKGFVTWLETGDLKLGAIRGGITMATGVVPFAMKTGIDKINKAGEPWHLAGFIISIYGGGTTTAIGEGTYAYISGQDVEKAAITGFFKGMGFGFSRTILAATSQTFLNQVFSMSLPILVQNIIIAGGSAIMDAASLPQNEKKKINKKITTANPRYDNCLTDAIITDGCSGGFEHFVRKYAIIDVTSENRFEKTKPRTNWVEK